MLIYGIILNILGLLTLFGSLGYAVWNLTPRGIKRNLLDSHVRAFEPVLLFIRTMWAILGLVVGGCLLGTGVFLLLVAETATVVVH